MKTLDYNFFDSARVRPISVCIYLPKLTANNIPVVIFSPGFQGQDDLTERFYFILSILYFNSFLSI